ncbi:replicative DNA helicase [Bosea minatitlanensis]|uniref:Replicative DNA helicase n=1 Tax=Bosea minatitlanensis TaxID=128782 RepID=A0ABW0F182_9HYPH|nr:replicative DNA helicase [Bosea minatitlanensis]MCT4492744.1 replicative DNA helicase [Bosea minatitlanensis]
MGAVMKMDGTPLDQRKLPHNIDAEQMLLGAFLKENDWFAKAGQHLKPEDFYDPVHSTIFDLMSGLIEAGHAVSPISMKPYVDEIKIGDLGGFEYLMRLFDAAPKGSSALANAMECAKIVKDAAIQRSIYVIFEEEMADILSGKPVAATKRLDRVETLINDLRPPLTSQSGFERFDKAAARAVDIAARAYSRGGVLAGLSTGIQRLDAVLGGLHRGDLVIVAGATSMGKTALGLNIAYAVSQGLLERQQNGEKTGVVAINSLEMPGDQIAQRILAEHTRIPGWRLRQGRVSENEFGAFSDAASSLRSLPIEIDATGSLTIAQLMMRVRALNKSRGVELLVVDYLQLLKGLERRRDSKRHEEVAEITGGLKALAKEIDAPIIALSQISRDIDKRDDKRPKLSDLRESGSIEMDADVVMFVYREEYYLKRSEPKPGTEAHVEWDAAMERAHGRADIILGKNRHGPVETIPVGFDALLTRFNDDLPDDTPPPSREKRERQKKLTLIKEATVALGILKTLTITSSIENDGHVDKARKGTKLVPYLLWREKCAEELLDTDRGESAAASLMEKVVKDLRAPASGHPSLIGRGGSKEEPFVWAISEKD